jgi:hypothetical protein
MRRITPCLAIGALLAASLTGPLAATASQPGTKARQRPANPPELKRLEAKAEEVRESFLRDTTNLIKSFEDVGQYDRAKLLLEALQKLDPQNDVVKTKLTDLSDRILDASEFEVNLDLGKSWQPIGAVEKGKPLRIRVSGDYKLVANIEASPDGAPSANPAEDLIPHVPFGAVMGVIAAADAAERQSTDKQPRPFTVGSQYEKPADRDGVLFLKVNVPPGAKCTGRLTALVSGAMKP